MNKLITIFSSVVIVALFCFFAVPGAMKKNHKPTVNGFAVVELFTSEGCSSCPPADEALIKLAKEYPANVYILGYHVDYWDRLGWKDAYSQASFTQRQSYYAEKLQQTQTYTPQVIINGKKEMVGSQTDLIRATIKQELNGTKSIPIKLTAAQTGNSVKVTYEAGNDHDAFLGIALVQLKAETNVKRGENGGKLLHHINIVRDLQKTAASKKLNGSISLKIPAGLSAKDFIITAFIQNQNTWKIEGAESISL